MRRGRAVVIPGGSGARFDHGAWDAGTDRIFVAHTGADALEVLDGTTATHVASIPGFPEAAGVVAANHRILVTCRAGSTLAVVDAGTLETTARHPTATRPNGVALASRRQLGVVACLGDENNAPELQCIELGAGRVTSIRLLGRPRWCVVDAAEELVFCAVHDPAVVVAATLPSLAILATWPIPAQGPHGIDLDGSNGRLYVACDEGRLVSVDVATGAVAESWALPGKPDATFYNPVSGLVHVAIGDPGLVATVNPAGQSFDLTSTGPGAKTSALVPPDRLWVFLPGSGEALELIEY